RRALLLGGEDLVVPADDFELQVLLLDPVTLARRRDLGLRAGDGPLPRPAVVEALTGDRLEAELSGVGHDRVRAVGRRIDEVACDGDPKPPLGPRLVVFLPGDGDLVRRDGEAGVGGTGTGQRLLQRDEVLGHYRQRPPEEESGPR